MGYALRNGLSFCIVDERPVFLDLASDRYFGLEHATGAALVQLADGRLHPGSGAAALETLVERGLLIPIPGGTVPQPCSPPPAPDASLLDAVGVRPSALEHLRATAHLARATMALKRGRLGSFVARIAELKRRGRRRGAARIAPTVADAYERLALVTAAHDRCLVRSLAVARHLAAAGVNADLVFGVRFRPFAAHCWVQIGRALVNDRVETVRTFTPIRVV